MANTKWSKASDAGNALPKEQQALLREIKKVVQAMARRSTSEAFDVGYYLASGKASVPEKFFAKWLKAECGMTIRSAWNYVGIHERLLAYRERLEASSVTPTAMFMLASAEPAQIEEVLALFEKGERLTTSQVRKQLKGNSAPKAKLDLGGAAGLRRAAEAKLKAELDCFFKLARVVLKAVEQVAADIRNGKHVAKTKLADKVEANCREASALLSSAISPVQATSSVAVEWESARRIIATLSDPPRWPGRTDYPVWIVDQVLPALEFVVKGTPMTSERANDASLAMIGLDVDEMGEVGDEDITHETVSSLAVMVNEMLPQPRTHVEAPALVPDSAAQQNAVQEDVVH
mgnify:CR=1 FL=1|jgi:hypothetical protein